MVKIQLIEPQVGYLDVSENTVFPLNFSVGDIRDLSKRSGTFSKTIQLPSTKNNNLLLNTYFDVNVVAGTFDVTLKQKCIVIQNGVAILDNCYLQLLNVKNNEGLIEYEVNIKSNTSDFFQIINNLQLSDLDFSEFNHTLDSTYVDSSFSNTSGFKYVLPYFDGNQITVGEALPCFFAKDIFDRIFQSAGYRYDWTTLSDKGIEFDKLLIPYNGEGYNPNDNEKVLALDEFVTYDTNLFSYLGGQQLIVPELQDDGNRYDPATGVYTSGSDYLGINTLKVTFKINGIATIANNSGINVDFFEDASFLFRIGIYKNGDLLNYEFVRQVVVEAPTFLTGTSYSRNFTRLIETNISNVYQNDQITFKVLAYYNDPNYDIFDYELYFNKLEFTINPSATSAYSGLYINVNQYLPRKIKQSDYIKSIFQMFNLYTDIDVNDSNLIIINTRDDYYDNGLVKDWTKKLAKNLEINTQFLPDVANKRYLLTYKKDNDQMNDLYFKNVNEIYGQQEYIFDSEFVRDIQTNELIFSPTPYTFNSNNLALSYIVGKTPKNNIRILYDGGMQQGGEYYVNDYVNNDGILNSTYPLAIHFNNHLIPTYDLNYGVCDFYFTQQTSLTNNNLYNLHWRRTLGQINNGKLVTAYFNLNELDINTLRLNDKIQVGNTLFNINKIIDYDANSGSLTKVELMTIDADVLLTPFITREQRNISRSDFPITLQRTTNAINGNANVIGDNNNVSNGLIIGDGNQLKQGVIIGDNNVGQGIIIGNNNTVDPLYQTSLVVGENRTVRYANALTSNTVDTENLYVQNIITELSSTLRTNNATTTTIYEFTPLNGVYLIEAFTTAYRNSTGDSMGVKGFGVFKVIAGVVTQVSTTDTVRKSNFPASVTILINTNGTVIRIRVTGLASATIDWNTNIKIYS